MILPEHLHEKNTKIINYYGLDHQLLQLTEECAEIIQEISKYRRAKEEHGPAEIYQTEVDLRMEIADIMVLFDQIAGRMDMSDEELFHKAAYKIDRQLGRMKK